MGLRRFAILPLVLLAFSTMGLAQKADVSFVAGGAFVSQTPLHNTLSPGLSFQD